MNDQIVLDSYAIIEIREQNRRIQCEGRVYKPDREFDHSIRPMPKDIYFSANRMYFNYRRRSVSDRPDSAFCAYKFIKHDDVEILSGFFVDDVNGFQRSVIGLRLPEAVKLPSSAAGMPDEVKSIVETIESNLSAFESIASDMDA